jgi:hypothetical protein
LGCQTAGTARNSEQRLAGAYRSRRARRSGCRLLLPQTLPAGAVALLREEGLAPTQMERFRRHPGTKVAVPKPPLKCDYCSIEGFDDSAKLRSIYITVIHLIRYLGAGANRQPLFFVSAIALSCRSGRAPCGSPAVLAKAIIAGIEIQHRS